MSCAFQALLLFSSLLAIENLQNYFFFEFFSFQFRFLAKFRHWN